MIGQADWFAARRRTSRTRRCFRATVAVNAICDPSGENRGSVSTKGVAVNRRAWPPLRGTAQRSLAYAKATRSRLTVGRRSSRVSSAVARTGRSTHSSVKVLAW